MSRLTAIFTALTLGAGLLATGCGGAPATPQMKPGPAIPGVNLSGKWYSDEFGDMKLIQTGKLVQGSYEDPRGPDHNGTVRGTMLGDLVKLEWIKPGNPVAAIMPVRGKATMRIIENGAKLQGRWGYDDDDYSGGAWNAEKSVYQ